MSKWMSIGFDPNEMDPIATPAGSLDQAMPSEVSAVSGLNSPRKHRIAGAIKYLVARRRPLGATQWKL
jgi:hypothetical protein